MPGRSLPLQVQESINRMSSLPNTVLKVMEVCNKINSSPAELHKVIRMDPVLLGKLMKLVNSAYYGLNQRVTSPVRAITMLGLNTVKNLALSTAVLSEYQGSETFSGLPVDGFWGHSLAVAAASKQIAKAMKLQRDRQEDFFVAGLLHDIGKIPLNNMDPSGYLKAVRWADQERKEVLEGEKALLGITHEQTGKIIGERWGLGEEITTALACHHTDTADLGKKNRVVIAVRVADYFIVSVSLGFSGSRYSPVPLEEDYQMLGIRPDLLDEVEPIIRKEIDKARVFLQVAKNEK